MLKGKATTGGSDFDLCPAGNHGGALIGVIDLGTHWESFQNKAEKKTRKVFFVWEVEAELDGADKRFFIGKDFNISMNDKGELTYGNKSNIRKFLEAWKGKPYGPDEEIDLGKFLGKTCLVNVAHKTVGTNNKEVYEIKGASILPKGMAPLKPTKELGGYEAESDAEIPAQEWLPRIFGETVLAFVQRSLEHGGAGRKGEERPQQQPVGAGAAASGGDSEGSDTEAF